ncbi:MAG: hypothetical protein AAB799_01680, partial [Patescibacteria group bacterium]
KVAWCDDLAEPKLRKSRKMAEPSRETKEAEMKTFPIVRQISGGSKRVDNRMVDTLQAIVRFPDGDTTRHLYFRLEQGGGTDVWTGWNSDGARRTRQAILDTFVNHESSAKTAVARVGDLEKKVAEMKGKKGVTDERKALKTSLKSAQAAATTATSDLAGVKSIVDKINETHPEIVEFK